MRQKIKLLAVIMIWAMSFSIYAQKPIGENWLDIDNVPVEDAICFALYTVDNNTLKMTAQLYPLGRDVDRVVKLQVKKDGGWETISATVVSEESYGWPVTIDQMDNYGRGAIAYLPEIRVSGMENPVMQVIYEPNGEVVYTVRIKGNQIQPKVFKDGKYTVKIGEQPHAMKTYTGLEAQEDMKNNKVLNVKF